MNFATYHILQSTLVYLSKDSLDREAQKESHVDMQTDTQTDMQTYTNCQVNDMTPYLFKGNRKT